MYDRPTLAELIEAVRMHVETQIVPAVRRDPKLYYHTLVAINLLRIAMREMDLSSSHFQAAWARLDALDGKSQPLPADPDERRAIYAQRSAALCAAIRSGAYDHPDARTRLFEHLKETAHAQLEVAAPGYLQTLAAESEPR